MLDNAVKYSEEGGEIELTLKQTGKHPELIFKNSTSGVKKGRLDIFFERFYREDNSRNSSSEGFGVGLSVAEAIVRAHKGKIGAQSPDGKTVIFTVTL